MANNSKLRLLRILELLKEKTDEKHPLSTPEIEDALRDRWNLEAYKNLKASSKAFVENTKATLERVSSGRKVSNNMFSLNFFQKEPVGGKVSGCTDSLFFSDSAGKLISDVKTVIVDKTNENSVDRTFRVRFTLKGQAFDKTQDYYLNIHGKGQLRSA